MLSNRVHVVLRLRNTLNRSESPVVGSQLCDRVLELDVTISTWASSPPCRPSNRLYKTQDLMTLVAPLAYLESMD